MIVVEDIIDTGLTLNYLLKLPRRQGPASIRICCLLDKPARRPGRDPDRLSRLHDPDRFVIGYGLDYDERYRNLPYIGVLKPSVYGARHPRADPMDGAPRRFRLPILLGSLVMIAPASCRGGGRRRHGLRRRRAGPAGDRARGPGVVIYGAAIAALVLLDIGYMRGRWGFVLDAPWVYLGAGAGRRRRRSPTASGSCGRSATCRCRSSRRGWRPAAVGVALVLYGAGRGFGVPRRYRRLSGRAGVSGLRMDPARRSPPAAGPAEDQHRAQVGPVVGRRRRERRRGRSVRRVAGS